MTKLVVLDWDDCITSGSSEAYYACYSEAIKKSGIEKTAEEVKSGVKELWGRPHRDVIAKIIGTDNSFLTEVSDNYEECIFTDTFSSHISLVSGAKQKLEELKDNYQLAIATGMDGSLLREHILPRFGMQDLFVAIRSSSELPDPSRGKPYPDMLLSILEELNVLPSEAVMVGDGKGDVLMAQAANVRPIVVLTGQLSQQEAEALGVTTIIQSVVDLQM